MAQTSQTQIVKRIEEITDGCIRANGSCTVLECSHEHARQYGFGVGSGYIKSVWDQANLWDVHTGTDGFYAEAKCTKENMDDKTNTE